MCSPLGSRSRRNSPQNSDHNVSFLRDYVDGCLRVVCSCGWSARVYSEDSASADVRETLQARVSEHLQEVEAAKKSEQELKKIVAGVTPRVVDL